jgi:predicted proteasome-type protease
VAALAQLPETVALALILFSRPLHLTAVVLVVDTVMVVVTGDLAVAQAEILLIPEELVTRQTHRHLKAVTAVIQAEL